MTELNFLGLGTNDKRGFAAFTHATNVCQCGFATSDPALYECPNCGTAWRRRDTPLEKSAGPAVGETVELVCVECGEGFQDGRPPVFAGGTSLAHGDCLMKPGVDSSTAAFLKIAAQAEPVEVPEGSPVPLSKSAKRRQRRQRSAAQAQRDV